MEEEVVPTTYSWWNAYRALGSSLTRVFRRLWIRNGLSSHLEGCSTGGGGTPAEEPAQDSDKLCDPNWSWCEKKGKLQTAGVHESPQT